MKRAALALLWGALLCVLGWLVHDGLRIGGDLRLFMPQPRTPEQRLLLQQFGEGPGARVLLLELSAAHPETLAGLSRALRARLQQQPALRLVANGEADPEAFAQHLLPYRYLLSPLLDHARIDADFLRVALQRRLRDLGSPAASLVEPWIARDPTLEILTLMEGWQPLQEPQRAHGVWFSRDGERALLMAHTRAPGFDPDGQRLALDAIEAAFAAAAGDLHAGSARLAISGPGAFSVLMGERTRTEATWLGGAAALGLVLLLGFAYRDWRAPLLGALPLASAALAGLAAVAALFGSVHGITIAFGFTLIGVAQDYPVHLLSHHHPGRDAHATVRSLWRTLATGVVSTCIAYLSFLLSGVEGLVQLATFTIAGLATAALSTRLLLPALLAPARRDPAHGRLAAHAADALARWPRPRALLALPVVASLAVLALVPGPFWEDSLASLVPVPARLLERDRALRAELGAPDVRHVLAIEGADVQQLLARGEALQPALDGLVHAGAITGYDTASRYLPSIATQQRRQARLPDSAALQAALAQASAGLPFRAGVFQPFVDDVAAARSARPLRAADLAGTPLGLRVSTLLVDGARPVALVALSGVADPAALQRFAARAGADVRLLDLRTAAESLAAEYRMRVVLALLAALALLALTVWVALRQPARVARVLAPMLLSTLLVVAVLHGAGVALTLFHLVALILAAGLGLDYALFVDHAGEDPGERRRTLHALAVCSASTLLVFSLLALSQIPVLRAIGSTVALGVVSNLALALLVARR